MKDGRSRCLTSNPPTYDTTLGHRLDRLPGFGDIAGCPRVVAAVLSQDRGARNHGVPRSSGTSAREHERTTMPNLKEPRLLALGLSLAALSFAPAAQEKKAAARPPLAEVRRGAARKQFELIWQYYQQNRV